MTRPCVYIGLSKPKSPSNVGAVMRSAGCFRVDAVRYTGSRYPRAAQYCTDTKDMSQTIPLTGVADLLHEIPENMQIICVELAEGATPLPDFKHPAHAIYIFGPEDGSLSQELLDKAHEVVYIPTTGCLNLAATVNVVLYDRLAKSPEPLADDSLIRQSRDTNNRLKVRSIQPR